MNHKRKFYDWEAVSALLPKEVIGGRVRNVRTLLTPCGQIFGTKIRLIHHKGDQ
jgi:hypothetical protein